jgi:hypothetical protein
MGARPSPIPASDIPAYISHLTTRLTNTIKIAAHKRKGAALASSMDLSSVCLSAQPPPQFSQLCLTSSFIDMRFRASF